MKIILYTFLFFFSSNLLGQKIDDLKLKSEELPKEYSITSESKCISIQACSFYDSVDMYSMLVGEVKAKEVQNFENKSDSGSIMYFEFKKEYNAEKFIQGLLWGKSTKPTKEHPEEFLVKGNLLIIWSFKLDSALKKLSQEKVKSILK